MNVSLDHWLIRFVQKCGLIQKCAHCEHTPGAVGSHLCCGARGAVGGLVPCSRAPRRIIEGEESAVHLLPPPTIPVGPRIKPATFGFQVRLSSLGQASQKKKNSFAVEIL